VPERLTCETLGLHAIGSDPGRERCQSSAGPAAGMTIVLDNRCARRVVSFYDQAYRLKNTNVAAMPPCDDLGGAVDRSAVKGSLRCLASGIHR
jgi:hypothetical protein